MGAQPGLFRTCTTARSRVVTLDGGSTVGDVVTLSVDYRLVNATSGIDIGGPGFSPSRFPELQEERRQRRESPTCERTRDRMRYAHSRSQGFFVGSGVVETGCKTIIGYRLKQFGMEWSVRGANAIISLRCLTLSGRFEDYWESRTA